MENFKLALMTYILGFALGEDDEIRGRTKT